MKKFVCVFAILLIFISSTGCGKQSVSERTVPDLVGEFPVVDDDGFIRIIIPENLLGGKSAEEAYDISDPSVQLFMTDYIANDDGSATFVMTPEQFYNYKEEAYYFALNCRENFDTAVMRIVYLDDFLTEINVFVDKESYMRDYLDRIMVSLGFTGFSGHYQIFCGVPIDQWQTKIAVYDWDTKELMYELNFPNDHMFNTIY